MRKVVLVLFVLAATAMSGISSPVICPEPVKAELSSTVYYPLSKVVVACPDKEAAGWAETHLKEWYGEFAPVVIKNKVRNTTIQGEAYELEIGDIPDNFTYYAMGHLHNYINDDFGNGKLVYPGSSEVWKTTELGDYRKNGKGFVIVDMDGTKPSVERIKIDLPREFIEKTLDYDNLGSGVDAIKQTIKSFDKKPVLNLTVNNVTSTSTAYEIINNELEDLALMIRPKFITPGEENIDLIIDKENALGPIEVLSSRLESYDDEDVTKFATELYNLLSKDKNEEAMELVDEFYREKYPIEEVEED